MSLPSNVAEPVRPLSHVDEFGNLLLSAVMSANAPAAMYFVISVLPISITSGVLPPASVASNFCRCVSQVWYWTSTFTPGWSAWNCLFAAATTSGQPDCASTWSQTVMPSAFVEPVAVATTTAAAAAAIHRATMACLLTGALQRLDLREPPARSWHGHRAVVNTNLRSWY